MTSHNKNTTVFSCLFFVILLFIISPVSTDAQTATSKGTKPSDQFVSIDFNDVDLHVFIKFISELTERNFVVDQRVKGKVTIISPARISINEAYKVFESVLEVHGYTAVKSGEVTKIVPAPDARSKSVETRLIEEATSPEDKVVTQLIPLKYASADDIKKLFAPMISKSSVILAYDPTNTLIVTDVYSNIKRLLRILAAIDVSGMGQEISVIPLEYADATKFVNILSSIFQSRLKPKPGDLDTQTKFVADERTNTIVVLASEVETLRINRLIELLDKETPRGKEKIRVYYLENANAEELAKVLQELPTKQGSAPEAKKIPFVSEKVKITSDNATNSLIIMGDTDDYQVLEEIIKKLDVPRAMVYIESLIMEVNVEKDFNLGVEWQAGGKMDIDNKDAAFGGGFKQESSLLPTIPEDITVSGLPFGPGFSLGIFSETVTIGNITFPNLAAVVNAYQKDKDVHILSTPQVLTTDNEEATITVGKNVPFQTRSALSNTSGGTNTVDAYSYYEYKDVGITLKITPQISKDRMVRLSIFLESTKLDELATTSSDRPSTLKRTVETTVIVKDADTMVIGGLIDDSLSETEYKVPCLGDVPLLGYLFKGRSRAGDKTNLFVFLTPHVIKSPVEAKDILGEKQKYMDEIEKGRIKMYYQSGEEEPANKE